MIGLRELLYVPTKVVSHQHRVSGGISLAVLTASGHDRHREVLPYERTIEGINDLTATASPRHLSPFVAVANVCDR
jgi:hypothetical protein